MLVVPWAPSKVLCVSAPSASQELHQQFSAWDFHLSQLNISKFKTKLLFPYSPSPFYGKSFPFHICTTHLFLPKQTNKQNNFFFSFYPLHPNQQQFHQLCLQNMFQVCPPPSIATATIKYKLFLSVPFACITRYLVFCFCFPHFLNSSFSTGNSLLNRFF